MHALLRRHRTTIQPLYAAEASTCSCAMAPDPQACLDDVLERIDRSAFSLRARTRRDLH